MAVTFYMTNNFKEICFQTEALSFNEKIYEYLIKTRERNLPKCLFLLDFDPYLTHRSLNRDEIADLIEIGEFLKNEYKDEKEIKEFAENLIGFFAASIEKNIGIFALGD